MSKKRLLVSAAGTATAWHIANTINKYFIDSFELLACDPLADYLIPASKICSKYLLAPSLNDSNYYDSMLEIFEKEHIDIYIPLIEEDAKIFYRDNPDLKKLNITSSAPLLETTKICSNKMSLLNFLRDHNIPVPSVYSPEEVDLGKDYFIKPIVGFGSRNTSFIKGKEASKLDPTKWIIQSICKKPEITTEVFTYKDTIKTICRERLATKEGVCVKARIYHDPQIEAIIKEISHLIKLPEGICIQFMKSDNNEWVITDFNIRLAAGTALSAAIGWDLVSACLVAWGNLNLSPFDFLNYQAQEKYVARVYQEIVMK